MTTIEKKAVYIIIAFTVVQLAILFTFGYTPYPDSEGYIKLANETISQGECFYPTLQQVKELLFVWNIGSINAVIFSLLAFKSVTPLLVLYSLMKGCSAFLVYLIAKKTTNGKAAMLALVIYAIYPANYGESTSTHSELPFIFFNLAGIAAALYSRTFIGGALMAIGNWFRPMGMVFLLSVITMFAVKRQKAKSNIAKIIAGYATVIMLSGGVSYTLNREFLYQGQQGWMALMQYSWDNDTDRSADSLMFQHSDPMYYPEGFDVMQRDSLWRSHFFIWLRHNPEEYFRQMPYKLAKTYVSDNVNMCTFLKGKREKEYMYGELSMAGLAKSFPHYSATQILTLVNLAFYYLLMATFCAGICLSIKRKAFGNLLLPTCAITLGTAVLLFAGHGEVRFHIPFMPLVIIAVAWTIDTLRQNLKTRQP